MHRFSSPSAMSSHHKQRFGFIKGASDSPSFVGMSNLKPEPLVDGGGSLAWDDVILEIHRRALRDASFDTVPGIMVSIHVLGHLITENLVATPWWPSVFSKPWDGVADTNHRFFFEQGRGNLYLSETTRARSHLLLIDLRDRAMIRRRPRHAYRDPRVCE